MKSRKDKRKNIRYRIRKTLKGTADSPRFAVFRSNKEIYAQIIDDVSGNTIVAASSRDKSLEGKKVNKTEKAKLVGALIGEKAQEVGDTEWSTAIEIAVNLYLDIINLFLNLLEILAD